MRLFSCLLCLGLLFAFPLNVSAADDGAINTRDLDFSASVNVTNSDSTDIVTYDVTDDITVDTTTAEAAKGFVRYTFPSSKNFSTQRASADLVIFNGFKFNSNHEYNLKFNYAFNKPLAFTCRVYLRFTDNSGSVLKEQILFHHLHASNENNISHPVNVDFKLDTSGIASGYKCELIISFVQLGYNSSDVQRFYVSPEIYLTDKDDDSGWFQKIIDAIHGIGDFFTDLGSRFELSLSGLGDAIDGFISDLSDDFSGFIDSLSSSISGDLDDQTEAQGGFFENLRLKLEAVGDLITDTFENISADFSARFDLFKPRIYEDLHWINAMVNGSGGLNTKPESLIKFRAVTSDLFSVPSGVVYNFVADYSTSVVKSFQIYQYYENDDFVGVYFNSESNAYTFGEVITLPEGYSYRFQIKYIDSVLDLSSVKLSDLCNSCVKLYADEGWLTAFGRLILNGFTGMFIPSEAFFDDLYVEVTDFYESKFGIFAQTTTFFYDLINLIDDVSNTVTYDFVFPEVSVPIAGQEIIIIEETVVDIGFWLKTNSFGSRLYSIYNASVWAIMIFCVLKYALRVEDVIFGTSKSISFGDDEVKEFDTSNGLYGQSKSKRS